MQRVLAVQSLIVVETSKVQLTDLYVDRLRVFALSAAVELEST